MSRARIGLFLPRLSAYGGVEGFALRLAGALAAAGHEVDFVCARQEVDPPPGVRAVVVGRPPLLRWLKIGLYALEAEKARQAGKYDLSLSLGKTISQDVLRASGGPLRIFWRLSSLAYGEGFSRGFKMARRKLSPANWLTLAIERRQFRESPVIVAVSHLVRDWICEAYPEVRKERVRVIYNLPDLSRFAPPSPVEHVSARAALGLSPGEVALSLAGTNFALKGVGTAIRALARLPENYRLLVAGGRNPGRFGALARELGVGGQVRFLGRLDNMRMLYHGSDCFLLPSYYDTCSNAVLEARACGLRVVSSSLNGSSRFLDPGNVIDDPGNDVLLAATVERVMAAPAPGPFVLPNDVACGVDAWVALVGELLPRRGRP